MRIPPTILLRVFELITMVSIATSLIMLSRWSPGGTGLFDMPIASMSVWLSGIAFAVLSLIVRLTIPQTRLADRIEFGVLILMCVVMIAFIYLR